MKSIFYQRRLSSIDGIIETFIHEGWISSYDIKRLQKHLQEKFGSRIEIINPTSDTFQNNNLTRKSYTFHINSSDMDKILKTEIQSILELYGYYIVSKNWLIDDPITKESSFLVGPRYPIIINDYLKEHNLNEFYHVTPKSNWSNIQKFGLAPRGTETTFYHPDDRIYLTFNLDLTKIKHFRKLIAKNENKDENDFLIFRTPFDTNYKYYLDETSTSLKYNIIACFVLQNIPAKAITLCLH